MAIKSVTTDYTGRSKDLLITQQVSPYIKGPQSVSYNFGTVSSCIAGVQKLIQRFVIALFNTGLAAELESARSSNIQEATHIFNFASWEVTQAFKAYQNEHPEMPEDEQLAAVQLMDISVIPGSIHLTINLVTKAGETVDYLLPVTLA